MAVSISTENLDQCLNELESLARQHAPVSQIVVLSLTSLNRVLGASGSVWALPDRNSAWIALCAVGDVEQHAIETWLVGQLCSPQHDSVNDTSAPNSNRYLHKLDTQDASKGCLAVEFPSSSTISTDQRCIVVEAFAEIVILAILKQRDHFLAHCLTRSEAGANSFPQAARIEDAGQMLVNALRKAADADRVSLVKSRTPTSTRLIATSSVMSIERNSNGVANIERRAAGAFAKRIGDEPIVHGISTRLPLESFAPHQAEYQSESTVKEAAERMPIALLIPLLLPSHGDSLALTPTEVRSEHGMGTDATSNICQGDLRSSASAGTMAMQTQWGLFFEWNSSARYCDFATQIRLCQSDASRYWLEQVRWFQVPSIARKIANWRCGKRSSSIRRILWGVGLGILLCGVFFSTTLAELEVEAPGTLQPVIQRMVFATHDGFVNEIKVHDGQVVKAGQIVATLRSPLLDSRIEELQGELRTLAEKRSGLLVAENQVSINDQSAAISQGRIAAEIRELDARRTSLKVLADLLDSERSELELRSPIDGTVVAAEMERNLAARPVRRGDPLFKIVAIDGPWRIEARVADRDSAYVRQSLLPVPEAQQRSERGQVRLLLTAKPDVIFSGNVRWISSATRNVDGTGAIVDVHIAMDNLTVGRGQMGATAVARIACGRHPWWFVQLRPLIEAVQRRFWF